jgi:hypothetical protein
VSHDFSSSINNIPFTSPALRPVAAELEIVTWKPDQNGIKKSGSKRRYGREERAKVAANRGYACAQWN